VGKSKIELGPFQFLWWTWHFELAFSWTDTYEPTDTEDAVTIAYKTMALFSRKHILASYIDPWIGYEKP